MPVLILARVLQGAGGGALQPLSQAILLESFPREKQGMAMAMFGLGVVGAPIIGPFLGGWLTDNYSWRWVFNINIPIGVLAIFLMARFVEDPPYIKNARPGTIDAIGFGLLTIWLATLQIVLDKGQQEDWFASTWITWFSVISAAGLAALIVRELRTPEPIVDLRVFLNRNFWVGTGMTAILMGGMYSALTMLPLFLQTLLGYTSQNAGLATAPRGIGAMIAMPIVGILMSYVDGRWLMSLGVAVRCGIHDDVRQPDARRCHGEYRLAQYPIWPRYGVCHGSDHDHFGGDAVEGEDRQRYRHLQPDAQPGRQYRDLGLHHIPGAHDASAPGRHGGPHDALRSGLPGASGGIDRGIKPLFH